MGDPAGCGPQITAAVWQRRQALQLKPFFVISDPSIYGSEIEIEPIDHPHQANQVFERALPILPISLPHTPRLQTGHPCQEFAPAIVESIALATELCQRGAARAMVTNPISKAVLYDAGFAFPGHTEFIAELCAPAPAAPILPVMMLVGGGLRVALATIHVPLMQVRDHLSQTHLVSIAETVCTALQRDFGLASPRIAFTGLNPHAGEDGSIGREELDLINPAAEKLRQKGVQISNARPADSVFHEALSGSFDAVIAMTHDQGLIPVKTLDMWGGVNTTLGLPIIRTSPDHGTAYEAAAARACRPDSLIAAISLAQTLADHRGAHDD